MSAGQIPCVGELPFEPIAHRRYRQGERALPGRVTISGKRVYLVTPCGTAAWRLTSEAFA